MEDNHIYDGFIAILVTLGFIVAMSWLASLVVEDLLAFWAYKYSCVALLSFELGGFCYEVFCYLRRPKDKEDIDHLIDD